MKTSNPVNLSLRSPASCRPNRKSWFRRLRRSAEKSVPEEEDLDHLGALHHQHQSDAKH